MNIVTQSAGILCRSDTFVALRAVTFLVVVTIPAMVFAGGTDWKFQIKRLAIKEEVLIVDLRPLENATAFPSSCETVTVRAVYKARYGIYRRVNTITREQHDEAKQFLTAAARAQSEIDFGIIYEGFESACSVETRALSVLEGSSGEKSVYAHF